MLTTSPSATSRTSSFTSCFHLDSKLFRTLRDLVMRPGELTAEYFAGRKKRYIAPLRLFLTLFALQFLAYSAYKPVAIYSLETLMRIDQSDKLEKALARAATKRNIPYPQLVERIEHRWQKNMSLMSLLSIVSLALMLKLLYLRHRRFLAEHLVFAAHFMCFTYLMSIALWPVYVAVGVQQSASNYVITAVSSAISIFYLYLALRRVYGQRGGIAVVKGAAAWATTFVTAMVLMTGSLVAALVQVLRA
ncbi:MAG: DUF3667 domain-containing protein [Thermoanaerobaculia bacterium]